MNNPSSIRGERLSFFQLLTQKDFNIEIPIIQRDYAQGRKTAREVRVQFIDTLFKYLDENILYRDLDFVYGNIIPRDDGSKSFVPLDGQQRLTTLFLLHWYLALINGSSDVLTQYLLRGTHSRFTYETRASAREFCNALVTNGPTLAPGSTPIAQAIRDAGWYFRSWEEDPTVSSMLTVLEQIETRFCGHASFYERLVDPARPVITFQFLNLQLLELTDDLYIKMNSRGKALSRFENFKAKLEQHIGELFTGTPTFRIQSASGTRTVDTKDYFSWQIDNAWADFFWKQRQGSDVFDDPIMNFIRIVVANQYALSIPPDGEPILKQLLGGQDVQKKEDYAAHLSFFDYQERHTLTPPVILALISSFDALVQASMLSENEMPYRVHYAHADILANAFKFDIKFDARLRLHAFLGYLAMHTNTSGLKEWLRVVYNLTENTRVDNALELARGLTEISRLLPHAPDIAAFLKSGTARIGFFYQRQVQEEELKANLFSKDARWYALIRGTENISFFRGQIGFLLEFSGILEYFETNGHCQWTAAEDQAFLVQFERYTYKSEAAFAYVRDLDHEFLWARAVLTKGDYLVTATSHRKNFLSSSHNERDYSWKRLLRLSTKDDQKNRELSQARLYVKAVLDDPRFDTTDIGKSCRDIIADVPAGWRAYFITNPELIRACDYGFIRFESESSIKLMSRSKLTYHYELRTYNFFLQKKDSLRDAPFATIGCPPEYGENVVCRILFTGFTYRHQPYTLSITYQEKFLLEFKPTDQRSSNTPIPPELQNVLQSLSFTSDNKFLRYAGDEKELEDALGEIFKTLQNILNE